MKFNDFSKILKQIWISMNFQELWEPWISPFIMTSETSNILVIKQKLP